MRRAERTGTRGTSTVMASLFVIQGRDQGRRFELPESVCTIGRDKASCVRLVDHEVSRRHAEIRSDGDQFELVDTRSSNGTFVNGERIERRRLASGDRIQVGRSLLIFTAVEEPSADVLDDIDIVGQEYPEGESQIVQSLAPREGSELLPRPDRGESEWLARARSNLDVMYRTALAASHTLDIQSLLQQIMDLVFEWVEADRGCMMLVEPETEELAPVVRRNRPGVRGDQRMVISRTILDYVMQHKEGVLTTNAPEDARFESAGSIVTMGVREAICVPLQGRYGVVGVIYIDTYTPPGQEWVARRRKFHEDYLKLMVAIGHQAALAIEDTRYYSAMVQAERLAAVGQTIAILSHHIKNILQGIRGGSYLIEEGIKAHEWDPVEKGWAIVDRNQERISNLVMDMLSFSKDRRPDLVPGDLNAVVGDVAELVRSRAAEAGVELAWKPGRELPQVMFDSEGMHRAVLNIVTNAIDACEQSDERRVEISTDYDAAEQLVIIRVRDTGPGIAPHDRERIFSLFESRKGHRGTGLGLAVSQKIMNEHDGEIRVESELGVGTCFTLTLPLVRSEELSVDAAQTQYQPAPRSD